MRTAPLVLALLAAGCASDARPRPPLPPPWPTAVSEDGRWRLRIAHVERRLDGSAPGVATISLQAQVEPDLDADTLLAEDSGRNALRRVVDGGGAPVPTDSALSRVSARSGHLFVLGLAAGAAATALRNLDLEIGFLRVARWKEFVSRPLEVGEGIDLPCPPARVGILAEPGVCWVSAAYSSEDLESTPGGKGLFRVLGHGPIAEGAEVRDARGRKLRLQSGAGSGGHTVCAFVPPEAMDFEQRRGPAFVEYPVTVTIRLPEEYTVEPALFRFENLRLPPPRRSP